jgi:hypothetical protein
MKRKITKMINKRFEAVWHEGEYGESMESWNVIEWTYTNTENGARAGRKVAEFYDWYGEEQAHTQAAQLQAEYIQNSIAC